MPPKAKVALSPDDIAQFLAEEADFAFEMSALAAIRAAGFETEHGGAYKDPVTGRIRTFDIRARWLRPSLAVRFAVECKNLRPHAPLLVHATQRLQAEAYHTAVVRRRIGGSLFQEPRPLTSVYRAGDAVGRQTDQPTKDDKGEFKSVDAPTYEKWSQAVSGCADLVTETVDAPLQETQVCVVVPMLVVPDGTLWQVDYDEEGNIVDKGRVVDRTSLILRERWSANTLHGPVSYDISHVEIVTLRGLVARMTLLCGIGDIGGGEGDPLT